MALTILRLDPWLFNVEIGARHARPVNMLREPPSEKRFAFLFTSTQMVSAMLLLLVFIFPVVAVAMVRSAVACAACSLRLVPTPSKRLLNPY